MKVLKTYRSTILLLSAMVIGGIAGMILGPKTAMLRPIADVFLNMLFTIVTPLIFVSLVVSLAKMGDMKKLGRMLGVMMIVFLLTNLFNTFFTWGLCQVWDVAKGFNMPMTEKGPEIAASTNILSMFTVNDFALLWSRKSLMALIVAALLFGVGLTSLGEKGKPLLEVLEATLQVIMKIMKYIMIIAPISLGSFFAVLFGRYGSQLVGPMSQAVLMTVLITIFYVTVHNSVVAFLAGGAEAVRRYWKVIVPPMLTSMGTCSSAATMPTTLIAGQRAGLSEEVNSVTIPLAAQFHKDGSTHVVIIKICFMASIFGINMRDPRNIFTATVIAILSAMVMGGIPGPGGVDLMMILASFPAIPPEAVPILMMYASIVDPFGTCTNVTGDVPAAMAVETWINGRGWLKKTPPVDLEGKGAEAAAS